MQSAVKYVIERSLKYVIDYIKKLDDLQSALRLHNRYEIVYIGSRYTTYKKIYG